MKAKKQKKVRLSEQALPVGTTLSAGQFTITGHLGAGGFGITYRAKDNVLGRHIVIKECFPVDFCVRDGKDVVVLNQSHSEQIRAVVKMFMREARSLAKLRHPNIVGVHRAFEENGTAYMVLDLIDGRDLFDILVDRKTSLSPGRIKSILLQLLNAIEKVHEVDLLHRDISPDNIIIEKSGLPVLIDFGAARGEASRHSRAISSLAVVKDGYSPQELYVADSDQAPYSDLYALAATFYHVLSGRVPANSQTRMMEVSGGRPDPCTPLLGRIDGYDEDFLRAIDMAMEIHPVNRLQSAAKWRSMIEGADAAAGMSVRSAPSASSDVSLELELSLTQLVEETNSEVRRTTSHAPAEPISVFAQQPEKPAKPDWIEEFNQETREPPVIELVVSNDVDDDEQQIDTDDPTETLLENTPTTSKPAETDWINRALEKQERQRREREAKLLAMLLEAEEGGQPVETRMPEEPAEPEVTKPRGSLTVKLLACLVFCGCFLFLFETL